MTGAKWIWSDAENRAVVAVVKCLGLISNEALNKCSYKKAETSRDTVSLGDQKPALIVFVSKPNPATPLSYIVFVSKPNPTTPSTLIVFVSKRNPTTPSTLIVFVSKPNPATPLTYIVFVSKPNPTTPSTRIVFFSKPNPATPSVLIVLSAEEWVQLEGTCRLVHSAADPQHSSLDVDTP